MSFTSLRHILRLYLSISVTDNQAIVKKGVVGWASTVLSSGVRGCGSRVFKSDGGSLEVSKDGRSKDKICERACFVLAPRITAVPHSSSSSWSRITKPAGNMGTRVYGDAAHALLGNDVVAGLTRRILMCLSRRRLHWPAPASRGEAGDRAINERPRSHVSLSDSSR